MAAARATAVYNMLRMFNILKMQTTANNLHEMQEYEYLTVATLTVRQICLESRKAVMSSTVSFIVLPLLERSSNIPKVVFEMNKCTENGASRTRCVSQISNLLELTRTKGVT